MGVASSSLVLRYSPLQVMTSTASAGMSSRCCARKSGASCAGRHTMTILAPRVASATDVVAVIAGSSSNCGNTLGLTCLALIEST